MFRFALRNQGLSHVANVHKNRLFIGATLLGVGTVGSVCCLSWYSKAFASTEKKLLALHPEEWREFKLKEKKKVSHDTSIYRFALQSPEHELDLPVASFIMVQGDLGEGKPTVRPYTPISYDEKGHFDLMIKSYPTGKISKYMDSLKVGDGLKIKGPIKKIQYKPNMKKNIGMIAGGSGITPMLQLAHEILKNPDDKTQVTLLYSNKTVDDILLRDRIDDLAKKHKNFKVYYTVTKAPSKGWTQGVGHMTEDMVSKVIPPPGDDTLIFVCGPPPMMDTISGQKVKEKDNYVQGPLVGILKNRGFKESQVFKF